MSGWLTTADDIIPKVTMASMVSFRLRHSLRPAIVEQLDTTTVIHPEQEATLDGYGNIIITEKKA